MSRWTEEQVALLNDSVAKSSTAREGFEKVSQQLGKSVGTVQQKYYSMQRQARGVSRPAPAPRSKPVADSTVSGVLAELPMADLAKLALQVKNEIDSRQKALAEASSLFHSGE